MAHIVRVWDAPTRLFHWCLVACVAGLFITSRLGGAAMDWHLRLGFSVLVLLLFRLIWGFVGGHWSRFGQFCYRPVQVVRYLLGRAHPNQSIGHNPAGSVSVWAMLGLLLLQVTTGLFSDDEIAAAGPLSRHASAWLVGQATHYHTTLGQYGLLALLGLHLAAVAFYALVKKDKLLKAMLTGDKTLLHPAPGSSDRWADRAKAALVLLSCAALVLGGLSWLG